MEESERADGRGGGRLTGDRRNFAIGAFAIVFDADRRVLLCHRTDLDVWNLPGGAVESGELPTEAVIREVEEETGLTVEIERLAGIYGKDDKDELVFSFVCRVISGRIRSTEEADDSRYFALEDFPLETLPRQVERVRDAIDSSEVIVRRQTGMSTRQLLDSLGRNR